MSISRHLSDTYTNLFPEYTPEKAFEAFYEQNYNSLPLWVNTEQFKDYMRQNFLDSIIESRKEGKSIFHAGSLLNPLIGDSIDMGGDDNYAFYFENINSLTGLVGDPTCSEFWL